MHRDARFWVEKLGLSPHPEGGYFRETYRASGRIPGASPADEGRGSRAFSTAIYYLLPSGEVSRLHRLRSDEVFHFYAGSTLIVHVLDAGGGYERLPLGTRLDRGEEPQRVVPAGRWFGATVEEPESFVLVGCTVAPGFEFRDFEQAERSALVRIFPSRRELIERLTPVSEHDP